MQSASSKITIPFRKVGGGGGDTQPDFTLCSAGLTCCVWDCGCREMGVLQDEDTEVRRVHQVLSGRLLAGCASFLCSLLRTLKTAATA